ncbi:hypothetical protein AAG747_16865 [Rapidithrix thailandica]|uniref:Sulfotransferase family protein n=1 Tax=Rapidithrix thailandica TaxID=413964 RepID=A0AAW9SAV1_9BACT
MDKLSNNEILVVVGMHRSTTSLTGQWLKKCGLNIGDRLLGGGTGNEKGHYEDLDFFDLHRQILSHNNLPEGGVMFPEEKQFNFQGFENIHLTEYHKKKAQSLIDLKNSLYPQWGWKEPRTCLFLSTYLSILPKGKYLYLFRDYKEVVSSMIQRDIKHNKKLYYSMKLGKWRFFLKVRELNEKVYQDYNIHLSAWIHYNKCALNSLKSSLSDNWLVLENKDLVNHDKKVYDKLTNWGFKLDYHPLKNIFDAKMLTNKDYLEFDYDPSLKEEADNLMKQMQSYKAQF